MNQIKEGSVSCGGTLSLEGFLFSIQNSMCGYDQDNDRIEENSCTRSLQDEKLRHVMNRQASIEEEEETQETSVNYVHECCREFDENDDDLMLQLSYSWDEGDL
jgi:hypothetical protein